GPRTHEARPPRGRRGPAGGPRRGGDRVPEGPRRAGAGGDPARPWRGHRRAPDPTRPRTGPPDRGALRGPGGGTRDPARVARVSRSSRPRPGGSRDREDRPRGSGRLPLARPRVVPERVRL